MTRKPLYQELAALLQAQANCRRANNGEWLDRHGESIATLVKNFMPSGSGIDGGTTLDHDASKPNRLVFNLSYHHMNDCGMYDGWTEHTLIVTPSLISGYDIRITGRNRNDIKEYLAEVYGYDLQQEVWQTFDGQWHSERYENCATLRDGEGI